VPPLTPAARLPTLGAGTPPAYPPPTPGVGDFSVGDQGVTAARYDPLTLAVRVKPVEARHRSEMG